MSTLWDQAVAQYYPTGAPAYSPASGNETFTNPNTGSSYQYDSGNWNQISTGINEQPTNTTSGGGGGGGGGGSLPSGDQFSDSYWQAQGIPNRQAAIDRGLLLGTPAQPEINFDALIAPALAGLDAAIAPLTQSTENRVSEFQQGANTAIEGSRANIAAQESTLGQSKTKAQQSGQSAVDEARRQYAEMSQGLQSRYGGTTGTGKFANELLGSQTLRNIADVRQNVQNAMVQLDDRIAQVKEIGRIAEQDIQDKTRSSIQQARDNLELQLADIRRQKGELQSRKAELAMNAMQIYQNTVNQVNAQNAQFLQNLYMQQQQAQQQLQLAQQKAQQIVSSAPDYGVGIQNLFDQLSGNMTSQQPYYYNKSNPQDAGYLPIGTPQAVGSTTTTSPQDTLDKYLQLGGGQ